MGSSENVRRFRELTEQIFDMVGDLHRLMLEIEEERLSRPSLTLISGGVSGDTRSEKEPANPGKGLPIRAED